MATIYFTSNADSGDGTLRDAMTNASDGDIIAPDTTAFSGLSEVVIALSSGLPLASVSIVGSPSQRIILDRQGSGYFFRVTTSGKTLAFSYVDFANGYRTTSSESPFYIGSANTTVTFDGCRFYNNVGAYSGFLRGVSGATGSTITFQNCVAWNNTHTNSSYSASVFTYQSAADPTIELTGCTFDTAGEVPFLNPGSYTRTGCLFDGVNDWQVDFDTVGFVDRTNHDYRLALGSSYLTGGSLTGDDILGHLRTGSIGAYDGSWIVADAIVSSDTTVDYLEISASGTLTLSGSDRILTVSKGVYFTSGGTATSSTRGYVVLPSGVSASALTLSNVVACYSGAGATNLSADETGYSWSAENSSVAVVLEKKVGSAWTTVAQTSGTSYSETLSAGQHVRLFDGEIFLTATVSGSVADSGLFYVVAEGMAIASNPDFNVWKTPKWEVVKVQETTVRPFQSVALLARIQDAFVPNEYFLNDGENVDSVKYSCRRKSVKGYTAEWIEVTGHVNVSASTDSVLDSLQTSAAWTADNIGYTFALTPDTTDAPLFSEEGKYQIVVTITPTDGNEIVIYFDFNVADEEQ